MRAHAFHERGKHGAQAAQSRYGRVVEAEGALEQAVRHDHEAAAQREGRLGRALGARALAFARALALRLARAARDVAARPDGDRAVHEAHADGAHERNGEVVLPRQRLIDGVRAPIEVDKERL